MRKPQKIAVKPTRVIHMTPAEWAQVPKNPYQKTKRAQRAGKDIEHLRTFCEEHATVRMGIYPDGSRCKIEGHTRGDIWENRPWLVDYIPTRLNVECYPVRDDRHAAERFKRVDNRKTAKNAADDVHGSFRLNGVPTESAFFKAATNIKSALQYAYEIVMRSTGNTKNATLATIDDNVKLFQAALTELDGIDVNKNKLIAPFITAYLLAYHKHGGTIVSFFQRINAGTFGCKNGQLACPIAKIETERDKWRGGGREHHLRLVVRILGALDSYMEGAFTASNYQPKVSMQKIMDVDLDRYLIQAKAKRTGRASERNSLLKKKQADN
jgi:hypothetical protein